MLRDPSSEPLLDFGKTITHAGAQARATSMGGSPKTKPRTLHLNQNPLRAEKSVAVVAVAMAVAVAAVAVGAAAVAAVAAVTVDGKCRFQTIQHSGRGESGWCSDMTSNHGAWRHAAAQFPLLGVAMLYLCVAVAGAVAAAVAGAMVAVAVAALAVAVAAMAVAAVAVGARRRGRRGRGRRGRRPKLGDLPHAAWTAANAPRPSRLQPFEIDSRSEGNLAG
jgi:hypothetical protein